MEAALQPLTDTNQVGTTEKDEPSSTDAPVSLRSAEDVFKLPRRRVAIASTLVAVAAVAALILVTAITRADELAVIALSLAILAFLIQIVVYIAQASAASAMMLRSETLNAQTSALLTEVQVSARAMQELVRDQFNYLLRRVIPESVKETADKDEAQPDLKDLEQRLTQSITQKLEDFRNPAWLPSSPTSNQSDLEAIKVLATLPQDDALTSATKILGALSNKALRMLKNYASREISQRSRGEVPMLRGSDSQTTTRSELLRYGLLGKVASKEPGDHYALTPLGREAARVLTAVEPLPKTTPKEVFELRERSEK